MPWQARQERRKKKTKFRLVNKIYWKGTEYVLLLYRLLLLPRSCERGKQVDRWTNKRKAQVRYSLLFYFIVYIGPSARSDWSKIHVLSEYKTWKKRVLLFFARKIYILRQMKKPTEGVYYTVIKHSRHLRTLELMSARVFYFSLVFSNVCRVLSQCNARLRLLYLLIMGLNAREKTEKIQMTLNFQWYPLEGPQSCITCTYMLSLNW